MSDIHVSTDAVKNVASNLATINRTINSDFEDVKSKMNTVFSSWYGRAGTEAYNQFNKLKDSFFDDSSTSRYQAMHSFVKYLDEEIASGYETTENRNYNGVSAFK